MNTTSSQRRRLKVLNEENGVIDVDNNTQEENKVEEPDVGSEEQTSDPAFDVDMGEFEEDEFDGGLEDHLDGNRDELEIEDEPEIGGDEPLQLDGSMDDLSGQLTTLQGCIDDVYAALKKSGNPHSEEAAVIRSKVFDLIGAVKSSEI